MIHCQYRVRVLLVSVVDEVLGIDVNFGMDAV